MKMILIAALCLLPWTVEAESMDAGTVRHMIDSALAHRDSVMAEIVSHRVSAYWNVPFDWYKEDKWTTEPCPENFDLCDVEHFVLIVYGPQPDTVKP